MQTKKILGIALCAALVSSMAATAAMSASAAQEKPFTTLSVIGDFNEWKADVAMTDDDGDGIYEATVEATGEYTFKVRADGDWKYSWGVYEEDHDRTQNSQTNCSAKVEDGQVLVVKLDTTKVDDAAKANDKSAVNEADFDFDAEGYDFWPVTFEVKTAETKPTKPENQVVPFTTLGVIGDFNEWKSDVAMTDDDGDGIYEAIVNATGEYTFKVRADGDWKYSWGVYEEEHDRTQNSQTNCSVKVEEGKALKVTLNTLVVDEAAKANEKSAVNEADFDFAADGFDFWPVTFEIVDAPTEDPTTDPTDEPTTDPTTDPTDEPTTDPTDEPVVKNDYDTVRTDYVFFDNSETKWDTVYAYWWHKDYAKTYDLEGNLHGCHETVNEETGEQGYEPDKFPGTQMTQIEGTDIWQIRVPFNAQMIIFGSGKSDDQIAAGEKGYQTQDLAFDPTANAGQIYKIVITADTLEEQETTDYKHKRGVEKTKYVANNGAWADYDGIFTSEHIEGITDPIPQDPTDEPTTDPTDEPTTDPTDEPTTDPTDNNDPKTVDPADNNNPSDPGINSPSNNGTANGTTANNVPKTGDVSMASIFVAVAAAALGAVVLASKKKERA